MKKILFFALMALSMTVFTACEKAGTTEVTVQAPTTESEFREVKWLVIGGFSSNNNAYWTSSSPDSTTVDGYKRALVKTPNMRCDYIKINNVGFDPSSSYNVSVWVVKHKKTGDSIEQSTLFRTNYNNPIYYEYK